MAVIGGGERDLTIKLLADVDNFKKNMDKASGQTNSFASKSGDALKKVGVAVAAAAAAAGAFAIKFGIDAVKAASDLQETLSKTAQLFGDNAAEVEKFAATAATKLGQSKQQALDAAANFAIFGKAAGLAGSDLVEFSTDFTVLASDLASFNNTSPEEAINAIGSALRGEAEPLRRYGVLLDDASLRQAALELGIVSTTKNALTPQQKVLAAQKLIFEQTSAAQGDFARTSDGLANGQRILAAQFENVKTTVGTALLPVVTRLFSLVLTEVIPVFERLADTFSRNVQPQLEKVWQLVEKNLLPILQVWWQFLFKDLIPTLGNALKPVIDIVITGIQFLINKVKENAEGFSVFLGIVDRVWQFIKTYVIPLFQTAFVTAINLVFRQIGNLIDAFGTVFEIIGKVARFLGFDLSFEMDKATKATNGNAEATANAYRQFQQYSQTVTKEVVPATTQFVNAQNSAAASATRTTAAINQQAAATDALARVQQRLAADPTGANAVAAARGLRAGRAIAGLGAGVNAISLDNAITGSVLEKFNEMAKRDKEELGRDLLLENAALLNVRFSDLVEAGLGGASFDAVGRAIQQLTVEGALTGGFLSRPTGSQSLGELIGGRVNQVNININGTVINPEGAARAVQDLLQQSGNRAGELSLTPTGLGIE